MTLRIIISIILLFSISACNKNKDVTYTSVDKIDPYVSYKEGFEEFENNNFVDANIKFLEAETNFLDPTFAAKSAIMSSFCLYSANFYEEAEESLNRYVKKYPAENVVFTNSCAIVAAFHSTKLEALPTNGRLVEAEPIWEIAANFGPRIF